MDRGTITNKHHHMMTHLMRLIQRPSAMRTTVILDDDLLEQAQTLSGISGRTELLREALRALVQRESSRRLARLGASEPEIEYVARRRGPSDDPR